MDLKPSEVATVLKAKVKALRASASEALVACGNQLWSSNVFNEVVKGCLQGQSYSKTIVPLDKITARSGGTEPKGADELRKALRGGQNPRAR